MASFRYRALDAEGKALSGVIEAESVRAARSQLRERALFPVDVTAAYAGAAVAGGKLAGRRERIAGRDLVLITRQWATLLASGLTVEQGLKALAAQAESAAARSVLDKVRAEVTAGYSLRAALDRHAASFPDIYRSTVAAGERTGRLGEVMLQLADHLEARDQLRRKTLLAMIYPALVAAVALLVIVALMVYVVPQVVTVFQQGRQALPLITRVLIAISSFLQSWGWLIPLGLAAGAGAFVLALRDAGFRTRWHARLIRLPVLGRHLRILDTTRFASTLGILVGSGVPLLEALQAGKQVLWLLPVRAAMDDVIGGVREGQVLSRALGRSGYFPPLLVHLVASGESTGRLEEMLGRAARMQQSELESRTALLTALLEPLLLLLMGGFVLLIVLAIMQPIIQINHIFK